MIKDSRTIASLEEAIGIYDLEVQMMAADTVKTLEPGYITLEATQLVLQMMIQTADHINKFGKTPAAIESSKRLLRLFDLISEFNGMVGGMNTLHLHNRRLYTYIEKIQAQLSEANKKLDVIKNAEEWGQK